MKKLSLAVVATLLLLAVAALVFLASQTSSAPSAIVGWAIEGRATEDGAVESGGFSPSTATDPTEARTARERVASTAEEAPPELLLTVVDASGEAVANARVWRWSEDVEPEGRVTDALGGARFDGRSEVGSILVVAHGVSPHAERLGAMLGEHRVTIGVGAVLEGWVRVDGDTPREAIELVAWGTRPEMSGELPGALAAELDNLDLELHRSRVVTRPDGFFRVTGLPQDWCGNVSVPRRFLFRRPSSLELTGARTAMLRDAPAGCQLDLTELPAVFGKVVWSDDDSPVTDAVVGVTAHFVNGRHSPGIDLGVESDGTFRTGLCPSRRSDLEAWGDPEQRVSIARYSMRISADGAVKPVVLDLAASDLDSPGAIGTVRLDRARRLHFVVRNTEGAPVADALVHAGSRSERADREGRGAIAASGEARRTFLVGAIGYCIQPTQPRSGSGIPTDPLVFVLERGNALTLRLRDAAGRVTPLKSVRVSSRERLFSGRESWRPTPLHRAFSAERMWASRSDEIVEAGFRFDSDGNAVLLSLCADLVLTVRVFDALGAVVVEKEINGPSASEHKTVDLVLAEAPFRLSGTVQDAAGAPLSKARVELAKRRAAGGGSAAAQRAQYMRKAMVRTGEDGSFSFYPVYGRHVECRLTARLPGHANDVREGLVIDADTSPLVLRLTRSHD